MARVRLHAVEDSGTPERRAITSITQAVAEGTDRDVLMLTRARLARAMDSEATPARDLAALSRRMLEVDKQLRALDEQRREEVAEDDQPVGDESWKAI